MIIYNYMQWYIILYNYFFSGIEKATEGILVAFQAKEKP